MAEGSGTQGSWTPAAILAFLQTLSFAPKLGVSVIIELLAAAVVWQLWQKPLASDQSDAKKLGIQSSITQGDKSQASTAAGEHSGSAMSSGQSGGITAGNYYQAPPVGAQQKLETLERLEAELQELKDFPNRPLTKNAPTIIESMYVNKLPLKLYFILGSYYKVSIEAVPSIGSRLRDFQKKYYDYQNNEIDLENAMMLFISQTPQMQGKISTMSVAMLRYFILRRTLSPEEIRKTQGNPFDPLSLPESLCEEVISLLKKDPLDEKFSANQSRYQQELFSEAQSLILQFKPQD